VAVFPIDPRRLLAGPPEVRAEERHRRVEAGSPATLARRVRFPYDEEDEWLFSPHFPACVTEHIFQFLPWRTVLGSVSRVNRYANALSTDPCYWFGAFRSHFERVFQRMVLNGELRGAGNTLATLQGSLPSSKETKEEETGKKAVDEKTSAPTSRKVFRYRPVVGLPQVPKRGNGVGSGRVDSDLVGHHGIFLDLRSR
jgi:hypothetical protein